MSFTVPLGIEKKLITGMTKGSLVSWISQIFNDRSSNLKGYLPYIGLGIMNKGINFSDKCQTKGKREEKISCLD